MFKEGRKTIGRQEEVGGGGVDGKEFGRNELRIIQIATRAKPSRGKIIMSTPVPVPTCDASAHEEK